MKISTELVEHIVKQTQQPREIAERLEKYQRIEKDIKELRDRKLALHKKYEEDKRVLEANIEAVHRRCDHPIFSIQSNYEDTIRECGICGGEF